MSFLSCVIGADTEAKHIQLQKHESKTKIDEFVARDETNDISGTSSPLVLLFLNPSSRTDAHSSQSAVPVVSVRQHEIRMADARSGTRRVLEKKNIMKRNNSVPREYEFWEIGFARSSCKWKF